MQWLFFLEVQVDLEIIGSFPARKNMISFDKTQVFPTYFEQ